MQRSAARARGALTLAVQERPNRPRKKGPTRPSTYSLTRRHGRRERTTRGERARIRSRCAMARSDSITAGLIPFALALGVVSSQFAQPGTGPDRRPAPAQSERPRPSAPAASTPPTVRHLADFRPVLDLLAESLGVSVEPRFARRRAARTVRPPLARS